jgi:hypothetical protein
MTTSQQPGALNLSPYNNSNNNAQCIDPVDMENYFDFNNIASPTPGNGKGRMVPSQGPSTLTSPITAIMPLDMGDDQQLPIQPAHEYTRFKQQTGLPTSMEHLRALSSPSSQGHEVFRNYNTGIDEFSMTFDGMGSQSGLGSVTGDLGLDMDLKNSALPAYFYPNGNMSPQNEDFVDPAAILKQEEEQAHVRFYPGMHQQAALARQAEQQKQQQMMLQKQKQREEQMQASQSSRRSGSHLDPMTEETIARVVNHIRQNGSFSGESMSPNSSSNLPHIMRSKKDEDDMDEDERLLNSEEGKKLSSKERRQLRNKVSARAFRSRRKEYIGQLEGELNVRTNEANELKRQNHLLMEENARFRTLAEKLLGHPAFHPFLEELSHDRDLAESLSKATGAVSAGASSNQAPMHKDTNPYAAEQQYMSSQNNIHVGMTLIPETPIDLSSLNLGTGNNWPMPTGMQAYQQHQVFAVTELPQGPAEPIDLSALSGKGSDDIFACHVGNDEEKTTYPEIESPIVSKDDSIPEQECPFDENDPTVALFATSSSTPVSTVKPVEEYEPIFGDISPEKVFAHFELFVSSEEDNQSLLEQFESMTARLDATCQRLQVLTAAYH